MGGTESMQDIGPDMDDLLRRAAEGYPLREPVDDWDKIASRLPAEQPAVAVAEKPNNKKRFLWLLLLLIPVSVAFYYAVPNSNADKKEIVEQTTPGKTLHKNGSVAKDEPAIFAEKETASNTTDNTASITGDAIQNNDASNDGHYQTKQNLMTVAGSSNKEPIAISSVDNTYRKSDLANDDLTNQSMVLLSPGSDLSASNFSSFDMQQLYGIHEVNKNELIAGGNTVSTAASFDVNNSVLDSNAELPTAKQRIYHRKLYYGVLAGVGFSSVKSYGLKKAGYDAGLFAGYRFTKNIAVEAGVLATQRYYMSRGDDFNTDNLDGMMQPGMKMMEVEGSSQGISIPLHVKLDLNTKKGNKVFAKTGFSSLIMTRESNFYHTMMNGSPELMKGIYTHNKNYFAASLDIAAGYEQNIKGRFYLRIEPYIQIPIKHVGVGDLPVTSAGLHVGISWPAQ